MFDLTNYINNKNQQINAELEKLLLGCEKAQPLVDAMRYSLMAGGKRIRPVLCLAATEAVGGMAEDALTTGCALEMVHTYSLIHDDLPAMDDDRKRRGKPTCHIAFDEATAILAGDALLTVAFEVLSAMNFTENSTQAVQRLNVIQTIATAAGCRGMIQGQMLDIASEGHRVSREDLEGMHALKTGALIEASLQCGALLGRASKSQMEMLKTYAANIGLAFQVIDDILNVEGNPQLMGKDVGTDALREKSTYPSLLGLEASKRFAWDLIQNALQAIETFDKKSEPLRAIAVYIIERKR
jgi:geranylgeranyl diphosphate synthase type II